MKKFVYILVVFSFIGCRSTLYYIDTTEIEDEISSICGCEHLASDVRNNFFFNKKDSVYLVNAGFMAHGLYAPYLDCLRQLSQEQLIRVFGPPNFIKNGDLYYIVESSKNRTYLPKSSRKCLLLRPNSGIPVGESVAGANNINLVDSNTINIRQFPYFRKAKYLIQQGECSLSFLIASPSNCIREKQIAKEEFFFNRKTKHFVMASNYFNRLKMMSMSMDNSASHNKCAESFTKREIECLFGKPAFITNDTLFYPLYHKPYVATAPKTLPVSGKIYTLWFTKQETGFYKYHLSFRKIKKDQKMNH